MQFVYTIRVFVQFAYTIGDFALFAYAIKVFGRVPQKKKIYYVVQKSYGIIFCNIAAEEPDELGSDPILSSII